MCPYRITVASAHVGRPKGFELNGRAKSGTYSRAELAWSAPGEWLGRLPICDARAGVDYSRNADPSQSIRSNGLPQLAQNWAEKEL